MNSANDNMDIIAQRRSEIGDLSEVGMLNIAIVEDELQAADVLTRFLGEFSESYGTQFKITRFNDPTILLEDYKPVWDIVFMDIEMPNMDGMWAAHKLRELDQKSILIFVTNMAQFASKGYEVNALDYIIKPYAYSDFERKIARAVSVLENADESIVVAYRGGAQRLLLRDIRYVEVRGHNVQYHTESDVISSSGSLHKLESVLSSQGFLRSAKAFLVNSRHVMSVRSGELELSNGEIVPLGRAYHKSFLQGFAAVIGNEEFI